MTTLPPSPAPVVSVVVVNWNGGAAFGECVRSVLAQSEAPRCELLVVDNASSDGSLELLPPHPAVTVLRNPTNLGFAVACNQAIAASSARYVALLNNDAIADPLWLSEMLRVAESAPRAGAIACKVLSREDPQTIDNVGHVLYADGLTRGRGRLERDHGQYEQVEEVFGFSGCAALLRRETIDDVGPFDPRFFAYCEDADLAFRARLRGWRCVYVPTAIAYHRFSASTGGGYSDSKAFLVERNRCWLAVKNFPLPLLLITPLYTLARYGWQAYGAIAGRGAAGELARRRSRRTLLALLIKAQLAALAGLGPAWRDRRRIQPRRAVGWREVNGWRRRFGIGSRQIALLG